MAKSSVRLFRRGLGEYFQALESRVMLSVATTPAPAQVLWDGNQVLAIPGEYIAQTSHVSAFEKLAAAKGFTDVTSLGGMGLYSFDSSLPTTEIARIGKYHTNAVTTLQPDLVQHTASAFPNDVYASQQWYLQNTGQVEPFDYNGDEIITPAPATATTPAYPSPPYPNEYQAGTPGQDIDAKDAWDITSGSPNVVIAMLDTGIDLAQPDLTANIWSNPFYNADDAAVTSPEGFLDDVNGWNFVDNNNDVQDTNGHGTEMAGIIGAQGNNSIGIAGVDWTVKLLPVVVTDSTGIASDADFLEGINYLIDLKAQGINIVAMNMSLSGQGFDILDANALKELGAVGVITVAAAGNDSTNLDIGSNYTGRYSLNLPTVITVAATDNQGKLAYFSNYGAASVDVGAPGINILTTFPTSIDGVNTDPVDPNNPLTDPYGYAPAAVVPAVIPPAAPDGTSAATAIVTGIIGLEAAANPNASPAQLKAALLDGVTFDPYLASVNGLPPKVATSGVVDAYTSVKDILNQYVSSDTTHLGNWHQSFGTQGAYIVGDSTTFPSFVTGSFDGASPILLADSTRNTSAPFKLSVPTDRISAYDASATTEAIDLDFTDGAMHRVSIYVANLDHTLRSEEVQIIDPTTGLVLDTQTITNLKKGEYLTWDLSGDVQIKLTNMKGPNVVFSGIFFDPVATAPTASQGVDTTTTGANWRNQYGSQASYIVGDSNNAALPSFVGSLTTAGSATKILRYQTANPSGLQKTTQANYNIEAYWYSSSYFDIDLDMTDTQVHQVTLYTADFQHKKRSERILAYNAVTGDLLNYQDISSFSKGQYVKFDVSGDVIFRVVNIGGPNAVISGLFIDGAAGEELRFLGVDTTSQGDWKIAGYGPDDSYVVGDTTETPAAPYITNVFGATQQIVADPSNDPRALQIYFNDPTNTRVEAYLFTTSSMSFTFTPGDDNVHQLALYFADYEHYNRIETVTFTNPTTGTVLSQQRITKFAGGKYFVYDLHGPVEITINNEGYPNAVLSGVFMT